jgi:hypothetical protein
MSCLAIFAPAANLATAATSANADIPKDASGRYPQFVRLAATQSCYVRLGYGGGATGTAVLGAVGVAVDTVGADYAVGDEITLAGGTSTEAIVLRVTEETGGAIDAVEIVDAGRYTVLPANSVAQGSTTGIGTGADFVVTWGVFAVTVTGAGSGYSQGSPVTFSGGAGSGAAGTVNVNSLGAVQSVTITANGTGYTSLPTVAIGNTLTAVAGDVLLTPDSPLVLASRGATRVAAIRVTADGLLNIAPVEDVMR